MKFVTKFKKYIINMTYLFKRANVKYEYHFMKNDIFRNTILQNANKIIEIKLRLILTPIS